MALKSYVSKSFSTGNPAFLIRVADRVGGAGRQLELGQAQQELDESLVARGGVPRQLLELRPIVGSRSCRKWVFSNSIVTSAIGIVLSRSDSNGGEPGPTVGPGRSGSGEGHAARDLSRLIIT